MSRIKSEIAFVDSNVDGRAVLLAGFRHEVEAILLTPSEPAPRQMAVALAGRRDLDAIHIIAHGAPGVLAFAAGSLSAHNIEAERADLSDAARSLAPGGGFLLWSCDVGAGAPGAALVRRLAAATGAGIAAATGPVGADARGGRWELDVRRHVRTAAPPLSEGGIAAFSGLLRITAASIGSITIDSGVGAGSGADFVTNDATLIIGGNVSSGSGTLGIWISGGIFGDRHDHKGTLVGSVPIGGPGAWSFDLTTSRIVNARSLANGTYVIHVTNGQGPGAHELARHSLVEDRVVPGTPTITSVTDDVAPGTGALGSGDATNDPDLTVRVGLTGTGAAAGDTVQLYDGGNTSAPLGSPQTLLAADVNDGFLDLQTGTLTNHTAYAITARVTDRAGNQSGASAVFSVTEDADAVCYMRGTHLATPAGETAVEDLNVGDIVITVNGKRREPRPIRWIGRRRIDLTRHRRPETVAPVRIQRDAFGDNLPRRELFLSPDHAIFVDGKLICAHQLVNGTTIRWVTGLTSVDYFHVELGRHAILLAEGLPAESYLNTGNRGFFGHDGEPLTLHPTLTDDTAYPTREAGSCEPFVSDAPRVTPVWRRLAERAKRLGFVWAAPATTRDANLQLYASGERIWPVAIDAGRYTFVLGAALAGTGPIRLVSRSTTPSELVPYPADRRRLGVSVSQLVIRAGDQRSEILPDHPSLSRGWHAAERDGLALWRWTNGDAVLPLSGFSGSIVLEVHLGGAMTYVIPAALGEVTGAVVA